MKTSVELQIELLHEEQAYLTFLRDRHVRWSREAEEIEVRNCHWASSNLVKEVIEANENLLGALQMQRG